MIKTILDTILGLLGNNQRRELSVSTSKTTQVTTYTSMLYLGNAFEGVHVIFLELSTYLQDQTTGDRVR